MTWSGAVVESAAEVSSARLGSNNGSEERLMVLSSVGTVRSLGSHFGDYHDVLWLPIWPLYGRMIHWLSPRIVLCSGCKVVGVDCREAGTPITCREVWGICRVLSSAYESMSCFAFSHSSSASSFVYSIISDRRLNVTDSSKSLAVCSRSSQRPCRRCIRLSWEARSFLSCAIP